MSTPSAEEVRSLCRDALDVLAELRRKAGRRILTASAAGAILILAGLTLPDRPEGVCFYLLFASGALFLLAVIFFLFFKHRQSVLFKSTVVLPLVRAFDPALTFDPAGHVSESLYRMSGLFPDSWDRFQGEDLVSGSYHGVPIAFSELHTSNIDDSDDKSRQEHTIFQGVIFVAEFPKTFASRTLILPDVAERFLGTFLGRAVQKMNLLQEGRSIRLEDPEFERVFSVYGEDDIEARYLLTPSLMSRLTALNSKLGGDVRISFVAGNLMIAAPSNKDRYEVPFLGAITPETLLRTIDDLALFLAIVDNLKLNERLWTK